MGLFDFLKPKKNNELNDTLAHMLNSFFPKGEKDINAVTDELLRILNNRIGREEARNIAVKSVSISRISEKFDEDRLKAHLKGYCLHHFNDKQVKQFHGYLAFLTVADVMFRKTPSEVKCDGDMYSV
jgi:hypothetical protein